MMRRPQTFLLLLISAVDIALVVGVLFLALRSSSAHPAAAPSLAVEVTALPSPQVVVVAERPTPSSTPTTPPSVELDSVEGLEYTVVNGDTFWSLSVRFKVSMAALLSANPYANPDDLRPGQKLLIPIRPTPTPSPLPSVTPVLTETPAPTLTEPTPTPSATPLARVSAWGDGLRFRRSPGTAGPVFAYLNALTPLVPLGRTPAGDWLEVLAPEGQGWVMAVWVELFIPLDSIPINDAPVVMATDLPPPPPPTPWVAPPTATLRPSGPTATLPPGVTPPPSVTPPPGATSPPAASPTAGPPTFPPPGSYPLISGISDHARQIFLYGQNLGNHSNVFSKVGDSITVADTFLRPIGEGNYNLGQYTYFEPVIAFFSQTLARTDNSFANQSLTAKGGWAAFQVINPGAADPLCEVGEAPLECEYHLVKPSVALIMIGTNDVRYTAPTTYEYQLRRIIQISLDHGVIPVISTIPPLQRTWAEGRVAPLNGIVVALAREYDIPLWDYWSAIQGLPNDGLSSDGVHPAAFAGHAADFTGDYMQYGMTVRNFIALQALDAVWHAAIY